MDKPTAETALRAIIARVNQDVNNPVLDPFRHAIKADDESGEQTAVDCLAIAELVLN